MKRAATPVVDFGRDCESARRGLISRLEALADDEYQVRVWQRREFREGELSDAEDGVNDMYDLYFEDGLEGLVGCEIRSDRELALMGELQQAMDATLAVVEEPAEQDPEARRVAFAHALAAASEWSLVKEKSQALLAVMRGEA